MIREYHQGKGYVVASMFADIDADAYIMVDGDDTYPAQHVHQLLDPVVSGKADLVVGNRLAVYQDVPTAPCMYLGTSWSYGRSI